MRFPVIFLINSRQNLGQYGKLYHDQFPPIKSINLFTVVQTLGTIRSQQPIGPPHTLQTHTLKRTSAVGADTMLRLDNAVVVIGFPEGKNTLMFSKMSIKGLRPAKPPVQRVQHSRSAGVMQPRREAEHLSPSGVEKRMTGAISPLPHMPSWGAKGQICLHLYKT